MGSPMPASLVEILDALEDPRGDRTKLHPLTDILVLSVLAVICGADSFVAIALFGELNEELLRMLCLKGCIVPHNAMGCQKAIAHQIRQQGADYVLRVRANHQGLHERMEDTWALERVGHFAGYAHDYSDTVGKNHGRIETHRCWTTGDPDLLAHVDPDREWRDLASLVWVESERRYGDQVATDVRCCISSLPPKTRLQLQTVCQHWSIENVHHWVMDVAFSEDDSRIRTGYTAHNLLRQDRTLKVGIANKRLAATWNKDYLCQLIGLKSKPV